MGSTINQNILETRAAGKSVCPAGHGHTGLWSPDTGSEIRAAYRTCLFGEERSRGTQGTYWRVAPSDENGPPLVPERLPGVARLCPLRADLPLHHRQVRLDELRLNGMSGTGGLEPDVD